MIWIYIIAAALITWGIVRDLGRKETWMLGFGRVTLKEQPVIFGLTVGLRALILLAVALAAWARNQF